MDQQGSFPCPICGEEVPAKAKACPSCGSCDKTGWSEAARGPNGLDLPEDPVERAKIEQKMGYWTLYSRIFFTVTLVVLGIAMMFVLWGWLLTVCR